VIKKNEDLALFDDDEDEKGESEGIEMASMFFYSGNESNNDNGNFIYFDSPFDDIVHMQGVSMNENFIFFWNLGRVWKLHLKT